MRRPSPRDGGWLQRKSMSPRRCLIVVVVAVHVVIADGCWLSGIDVSTQMLNQQYQEPWLAIVIDPHKTAATGKVDIGAFRTYPQGYKPPEGEGSEFESVPLSKIEDFGAHQNQYYQLEISYFKSTCDTALLNAIWNKYWIATLSASPLLSNAAYISAQVLRCTCACTCTCTRSRCTSLRRS